MKQDLATVAVQAVLEMALDQGVSEAELLTLVKNTAAEYRAVHQSDI